MLSKSEVNVASTEEYGLFLDNENIGMKNQDMELFFADIYMSSSCTSKKNSAEWIFSQNRKYNIDCVNLVDSDNCVDSTNNNAYFVSSDTALPLYDNENFEQYCRRKCAGKFLIFIIDFIFKFLNFIFKKN